MFSSPLFKKDVMKYRFLKKHLSSGPGDEFTGTKETAGYLLRMGVIEVEKEKVEVKETKEKVEVKPARKKEK